MKKFYTLFVGYLFSVLPFPQRVQNLFFWPLATRILGKEYKQRIRLKNSIVMNGGMEDVLTRLLLFLGPYFKYFWEPVTTRLLEELAKKRKSILIAGSHVGYMALIAAKETSGNVVAFEPVSHLYKASQDNFSLNPNLRLTLERVALGNRSGKIEMYVEDIRSSIIPYSGGHSKEKTEEVPILSIDAYLEEKTLEPFDLIFLDIEGYELFALEGASKALESRPDLILEVSPKILSKEGRSPDDLYDFLRNRGYLIYFIKDNYDSDRPTNDLPEIDFMPISELTEAGYNSLSYFNIFATVREIDNLGYIR